MKKAFMAIAFSLAISAYADDAFFELVMTGTPNQVRAAITAGTDVNARDEDGETPLMSAVQSTETPQVITLLIEAGADAKAEDEDGNTASDHAKDNDNLKDTDAYWALSDARWE